MTNENEKKPTLKSPPAFIYDVDLDEFYESRLKEKTGKAGRKQSTGRYEVPEYVKNVYAAILEAYPDTCPPLFLIDKIIKAFWREIERELIEEETIKIFGFGQFILTKKISSRTNQEQYYIKFKISRHFISRIREHFGTLTESERNSREKQKEFMKKVWESRMKTKLTPKIFRHSDHEGSAMEDKPKLEE